MSLKFRLLLLVFLIVLAGCSNVGETYRLSNGDHLGADSHIVVVNVELAEGSLAEGNLNITASDAKINNHIQGDLTIVASEIQIGEDAIIEGNLIYCLMADGNFSLDENAIVWGDIRNSCDGSPAKVSISPPNKYRWAFVLGINTAISLVVGLLAALGTILFPSHLSTVQNAALRKWMMSLGLGLLSLAVGVGLSTLWGLTLSVVVPILLAPFILLGWFMTGSLATLGFISIAQSFGSRLVKWLPIQEQLPVVSTTLGAGTLSFLILACRIIPAIATLSTILFLLMFIWSLGAALLTLPATRRYQRLFG
jgi:hypothetical protein